jgi:Na+/melibiose symporter-like transporter
MALELSGFIADARPQLESVNTAIIVLMGGFPLLCYVIGAFTFSRFNLTESDHARIRADLDARANAE